MKQKNIKVITIAIIALVILAGIVVVNILGFNKELRFSQSQSIDVYVGQKVDKSKIEGIANDNLGEKNMVQTVEIYEDLVTIRAKEISEEQKNNIVNKIKENYEFEQKVEDTIIKTVPSTRIRDMYKQYVLPFAISGILVLAYMTIRYHKKGILKVLGKTIAAPVLGELFLISIIAIARIPVGRFIPVLVIVMYIASIWFVIKEIEK